MGRIREWYRKEIDKEKYQYRLQQEADLDETERKVLETFKRNQNHSR